MLIECLILHKGINFFFLSLASSILSSFRLWWIKVNGLLSCFIWNISTRFLSSFILADSVHIAIKSLFKELCSSHLSGSLHRSWGFNSTLSPITRCCNAWLLSLYLVSKIKSLIRCFPILVHWLHVSRLAIYVITRLGSIR